PDDGNRCDHPRSASLGDVRAQRALGGASSDERGAVLASREPVQPRRNRPLARLLPRRFPGQVGRDDRSTRACRCDRGGVIVLKVGHTGITWGIPGDVARAYADVSDLGYSGFETFGSTLRSYEGYGELASSCGIPTVAAFCWGTWIDPATRDDEVA